MNRAIVLSALGEGGWPLPGGGDTARRHRRLFDLGRKDLSLARILEAHTDALAILQEAGHAPRPKTLYGVWASDGPHSRVEARPSTPGHWRLSGVKQYCSGATFCNAALITAHHDVGVLLFDLSLDGPGVQVQPSSWTSAAFAETGTSTVRFMDLQISDTYRIDDQDWYLRRPGFWHGAVGPAACWAGGAASLADHALRLGRKDPHSLAHVGAMQASIWGMMAFLDQAGHEIDDDPMDHRQDAQRRALRVRHLIERECAGILDRFGRATGPQLLAFDAHAGQQYTDLTLYIRQCHAERDLVALAETFA